MLIYYKICFFTNSELYHGDNWLNDSGLFTPMTTSACGNIFVFDFIHCSTMQQTVLAKINHFFSKVCNFINLACFMTFTYLYRIIYLELNIVEITLLDHVEQDYYIFSEVTTIGISDMITVAAPPSRIMLWNGTNYCPLLEEVNVSISKYIKNKFVCFYLKEYRDL